MQWTSPVKTKSAHNFRSITKGNTVRVQVLKKKDTVTKSPDSKSAVTFIYCCPWMVLYNGLIVDAQKQSSPPCICKLTHSSVRVLLSMLSQMHSFTRVYWAAGTKKINSLLCLWLWDINWIFSWFCASLSWFLHQLVDYRQNGEHPSFGSSVSFSRPGLAGPQDSQAGDGPQNHGAWSIPEKNTAPTPVFSLIDIAQSTLGQVPSHVKWHDKITWSPTSFPPPRSLCLADTP